MLYMFLTAGAELGAVPPQGMIDAIEKLSEQETAAGRLLARGGLMPTGMGAARLQSRRGQIKLTDGPFTESKEVIGGFAIFEFATREEALASAQAFMDLHRTHWPEWEGMCEMRPMFGFEAVSTAHEEDVRQAQ